MSNDTLVFREFVPPFLLRESEDPDMIARSLLGAMAEYELEAVLTAIQKMHLSAEIGETDHIDLILKNMGNPFAFPITEKVKRRLARALPTIYRSKGTGPGIEAAVLLLTGIVVEVVPDGTAADWWILGVSELGVGTYLNAVPGTRDELTFIVRFVSRNPVDDDEFDRVKAIVRFMKYARTLDAYELIP